MDLSFDQDTFYKSLLIICHIKKTKVTQEINQVSTAIKQTKVTQEIMSPLTVVIQTISPQQVY
jgi:hypothetical protein